MKKPTIHQKSSWLTDEHKEEVRKLFEPRYKRKLQDSEVEEIAENLTGFMEAYLKFKWRQKQKKQL